MPSSSNSSWVIVLTVKASSPRLLFSPTSSFSLASSVQVNAWHILWSPLPRPTKVASRNYEPFYLSLFPCFIVKSWHAGATASLSVNGILLPPPPRHSLTVRSGDLLTSPGFDHSHSTLRAPVFILTPLSLKMLGNHSSTRVYTISGPIQNLYLVCWLWAHTITGPDTSNWKVGSCPPTVECVQIFW